MVNFKDKLNINWRVGFRVDMYSILEELQRKYERDLKISAECFETYDEVSDETFNDFEKIKAKFELLMTVGYLDEDEVKALTEYAESLRYDLLYKLENEEKEGEKDGSKEEC